MLGRENDASMINNEAGAENVHRSDVYQTITAARRGLLGDRDRAVTDMRENLSPRSATTESHAFCIVWLHPVVFSVDPVFRRTGTLWAHRLSRLTRHATPALA